MVDEKCAIKFIEHCKQRYICTLCDPPKAYKNTQDNNIVLHFQKSHDGISNIQCIYCLEIVPLLSVTQHIDLHFQKTLKEPYICSVCAISKSTAKALAQHSYLEHSINHFQLFSKCSHCNSYIGDPVSLKNHLEKSRIRIYHCAFPSCNVKSKNLSLIIEHAKSCHKISANSITHSIDYMCAWPKSQQPCDLDNAESKGLYAGKCDQSICLSCPHCAYITQKMESFAKHVSSCKSNHVIGQLSVTCILYRCPLCKKASTSQHMIREHLSDFHESVVEDSAICQEDFVVPIEEPQCPPDEPVSFPTQNIEDISNLISTSLALSNLSNTNSSSIFPDFATMAAVVSAAAAKPQSQDSPTLSNETHVSNNIDDDKSIPTNLKPIDPTKPLPTHIPTGQMVEEWVHLYFHETEFLSAFKRTKDISTMSDITDSELNTFLDKLRTFATYKVPILGRANQRRVAACPMCYKPFNHGFTDLKKHLLISHMDVRRDLTRFCINYTHSPKYNAVVTGVHTVTPNTTVKTNGSANIPPPNIVIDAAGNVSDYCPSNILTHTVPHYAEQSNEEAKLMAGKNCNGNIKVDVENSKNPSLTVPISLERICKHEVDCNTIHEAENNRPTGRGGIVPIDDIGNPVEAAIKAARTDDESGNGVIFRPIPGKQRIHLAYSLEVLNKLFRENDFAEADRLFLLNRLNRYARMYVMLEVGGRGVSSRRYSCALCTYSSVHSLADVRKHVMGAHCGISQKRFRLCLRASRHDSASYRLLSDQKMIQFVDLQKRRASAADKESRPKEGKRTRRTSANNGTEKTCPNGEIESVKNGDVAEDDDDPDAISNADTNEMTIQSLTDEDLPKTESTPAKNSRSSNLPIQATKEDLKLLKAEQNRLKAHLDNPSSGSDFISCNGSPINLRPGETGQRIDLPYSESVLRQLMDRENYSGLPDVIVEKMGIYTRYHLIVVSKLKKIHAFVCVCGRRFGVVREDSDNDIRPASLADVRRHVLGVHARIPQDLLTLCSQASRISKETSYKLYPEKALLALAHHHKMRSQRGIPTTATANESAAGNLNSSGSNECRSGSENGGDINSLHEHSNNMTVFVNTIGQQMRPGKYADEVSINNLDRHCGLDLPGTGLLSFEEAQALIAEYKLPATWRLERVINLAYSKSVFEKLVERQHEQQSNPIEADFLSSLHERMKVYSRHSVYSLRQVTAGHSSGRRFHACSVCLAASPHGLADVRKHILGVHAHVPERYKTIAMASGRLSREHDYALCTDAQLASMAHGVRPLARLASGMESGGVGPRRKRQRLEPLRPLDQLTGTANNSSDANSSSMFNTSVWPGQLDLNNGFDSFGVSNTSGGNDDSSVANNEATEPMEDEEELGGNSNDSDSHPEDEVRPLKLCLRTPKLEEGADPTEENEAEFDDDEGFSPPAVISSPAERRPPIILNLRLPKQVNGAEDSSSPTKSPDDSNNVIQIKQESPTQCSSSRSRRSVILKSKRPLPTSN